jgi:hypothetical protein
MATSPIIKDLKEANNRALDNVYAISFPDRKKVE